MSELLPAEDVQAGQKLLPSWLHAAHESFVNMAGSDRLPHALIIQSPLGWCERSLAAILVCHILDLPPQLQIEELAHADLKWLAREEGSLFYKVEQLRESISFMQRTAQGNGNKVIVVPHAHRMNDPSANTLLKTLEEPPPGSHWLLLCNEPGQLLATIRSRCQSVVINPSADLDTTDYVRELVREANPEAEQAIVPAALTMLLFEFLGAPEQVAAAVLQDEEPIWPFLAGVLDKRDLISDVSDRWSNRDLAELTGGWQRYVHAVAAQALPAYAKLDKAPDRQKLFKFVDELRDARELVTHHAGVNRRLLLERLLLRWCTAMA